MSAAINDSESVGRRSHSCLVCKIPVVLEKGTVVTLVWSTLLGIALFVEVINGSAAITVMSLTFPVVGWIADTWIGRYKVLRTAMQLQLLSCTLGIPVQVLLMYYTSSEVVVVLNTILTCLVAAGMSCYCACILQFTTDQMIGASSDQLSFAVRWVLWGLGIGLCINDVLHCVLESDMALLVSRCLAFVALLAAFFVLWYWNDSLMTVPQISNPIKHIFRVLNYARKHKFPERRSALTYWEQDYPSRIDLGMNKYGGPFTVEEVEDVKTTFRLIPVVLCAAVANAGSFITWYTLIWEKDLHPLDNSKINDVLMNSNHYGIVVALVVFPFSSFFHFPHFHRYIPTMLKRIAAGILLVSVSYFLSAVLGMLQVCSTTNHESCFIHSPLFNISENGLWWTVVPTATWNIGFLLVFVVLSEFFIAQTPQQVKGLMGGILIGSFVISSALGWMLYYKAIPQIFPIRKKYGLSHWFYGNMLIAAIIFLAFILFVFISKRYKLRKRDEAIPYHMFAEDYFENNYRREREYLKQMNFFSYGFISSSLNRSENIEA